MGKLFKRRKNKSENEFTVDTPIPIHPFAPDENLVAADYIFSNAFFEFESTLEEKCKEALSQIHADQYNVHYMDSVIDKMCETEASNLLLQRSNHRYIIDMLANKVAGNISRVNDCIKRNDKELTENAELLRVKNAIYYKGTAYDPTNSTKEA